MLLMLYRNQAVDTIERKSVYRGARDIRRILWYLKVGENSKQLAKMGYLTLKNDAKGSETMLQTLN